MANNVATLATSEANRVRSAAAAGGEPLQVSPVIRKLFVLLHGTYGNLFISKFSTGEKDADGRDKGIRAAMKVWEAKLGQYPADIVEAAAGRVGAESPEYPPSLPQFEKVCQAVTPRKTYAQEMGLVRLPAPERNPIEVSFAACNDGKDWARRLLARVEAGDKCVNRNSLKLAREAMGMEVRK